MTWILIAKKKYNHYKFKIKSGVQKPLKKRPARQGLYGGGGTEKPYE
jgi:hypothetical protein